MWTRSPTLLSRDWSKALFIPLVLLVPMAACTIENSPSPNPTTSGDIGEDIGEETSDDQDTGGSGQGLVTARGDIALTLVVTNQGVDVPIVNNGEWVGPADRNTYVVANRDTLLRAFWEIPEDWEPREITARLELIYADGTTKTFTDPKLVEGPSFAGDIERNFWFALLAEEFPPGVQFQISLLEDGEASAHIRESTTVTQAPSAGPQQIGIQPEPAELKVVFIPVQYNTPGCTTDTSTLTVAEEQEFIDLLHEHNPVHDVKFDFRRSSPIVVNAALTSLSQLWAPLQEQRITDGASPNVYYYALINVCGGGIDGAAGIAPGTPPPTKDAAYQRVSSGVWLDGDSYSYGTFVHELGHNQGRPHTFCIGGGAAGTDPSYPHENGIIGVWGFGIRQFKLFSPTGTFDYMSYCSPTWVSDWSWSKTYNQIRALTAWDFEGPAADEEDSAEVLIGLLFKNGTESWWTTKGGREAEYFSSAQAIDFDFGQDSAEIQAAVELLADGTRMVVAPLPCASEELSEITRIDSVGTRHAIDLDLDFKTP